MATDLSSPASDHARPAATTARRRGWIVLAIGVWNLWVWGTRLRNVLTDGNPNTTAFDLVHSALFTVSMVLAVVLCVVGWRLLREART